VATLALVSPLHEIGEASLLSAHMLQHVALATSRQRCWSSPCAGR